MHLCKLGQLRRSNGRNSQVFGQAMKKRPTGHTLWPEKESYGRHTFVHFFELVEGRRIHFPRGLGLEPSTYSDPPLHVALGPDLRRPPVRLFKLIPAATTRSIHTSRGETLHLLPAAGRGAVSLIRQLRERTLLCSSNPGPAGSGARRTRAQFYHVTV